MIVGGYTLDLYCDVCKQYERPGQCQSQHPGQFFGRTHAQCVRKAKRCGWKFHRDRQRVMCDLCTAEKRQWKELE